MIVFQKMSLFLGFLPGPAHDSALDYAFQVPGEKNNHFRIGK